jgi:hypothetical protein
VKNDDFIDCSSSLVSTRWWGVGIFSLARVGRWPLDLIELPSKEILECRSGNPDDENNERFTLKSKIIQRHA